ncbi:MFS transporter [Clavibacter michiganensis]|uniref:MFS transporter n=2 Tax=Clavibacter michiganensis TaxID=28447 RepID=A0A2S5VPS3_9MICO|nr:MFS transporter [Clavibacter michiganensis]
MADAVREQHTGGASRVSPRVRDGVRPPGSRRAEIGMPIALLGLFVALLPPIIVSLALKVNEVAPGSTAGTLSLVLGLGAVVALVVNPLAGRLSDRTTGRLGMRRPWIIGGVVLGYGALVLLTQATTVLALVGAWMLVQACFNAAIAALIAVMADSARPRNRGRVAAAVGVAQNGSLVVGTFIVQLFATTTQQVLVPGAVGVAVVVAFALVFRDRVLVERPAAPLGVRELLGSFVFDPRRNPDFGWAWLMRFLLTASAVTATNYLALYLIDDLGVAEADVANAVFLATLFNVVGVVSTTFVAGWLSDRLGRRKVFVAAAALVAVVGLVILALAPSLAVVYAAQLVIGAGIGSFYAVDLALITDVLPSDSDNGKDLGVVNIAQALPQSLVPTAAGGVVAVAGYPGLFLAGAAAGLLGAVAAFRVKGVR